MFSVKGWNVDSTLLRQQTEVFSKAQQKAVQDGDLSKASRKRKRGTKQESKTSKDAQAASTTTEPQQAKKRRNESAQEPKAELDEHHGAGNSQQAKKRKNKPAQQSDKLDESKKAGSKPVKEAKLTPMQAAMRQKLVSARFRHLNETLYTSPSQQAQDLFDANPDMFEDYHSGFRQQVSIWPENPVDKMLQKLQEQKLPRTKGTCVIADCGCGDARISQTLNKDLHKLNMKIHSFDLHSPSKLVTKADISKLPLANDSVNIVIFCLALMGTNWVSFIKEAHRVLNVKGELWIAEIKSRFARPKVVEHSVGKKRKVQKEEVDEIVLQTEVDGAESRNTDTSAFLDVLSRNGFTLKGEDSSNKMFVSMVFVKSSPGESRQDDYKTLKPCLYKIR